MEGQKWYYHSNITAQTNKTNNTVRKLKQMEGEKWEKAKRYACEIQLCFVFVQNLIDQSGSMLENVIIQPNPFPLTKQVGENRRVKVQPHN